MEHTAPQGAGRSCNAWIFRPPGSTDGLDFHAQRAMRLISGVRQTLSAEPLAAANLASPAYTAEIIRLVLAHEEVATLLWASLPEPTVNARSIARFVAICKPSGGARGLLFASPGCLSSTVRCASLGGCRRGQGPALAHTPRKLARKLAHKPQFFQ